MLQDLNRTGTGIRVSVTQSLSPLNQDRVAGFLSGCASASWLQQPEYLDLCPPPPRHRYVMMTAYGADGGILGFGLARLSRLGPWQMLASFRRGPVTRTPQDLARVLPAFAARLRRMGCCSLQLNPRWTGPARDEVCALLNRAGVSVLPAPAQSQHAATAEIDLSGMPEQLMGRLKPRARRQIRKAEKSGLTVRPAANAAEAQRFEPLMQAFFRARGLGLEAVPPVAKQWQMTRKRGAFLLAYQQDRLAGGHVMIADGNRAFWLVLARGEAASGAAAGYPLIWEALKHAQAQGFDYYDMAGAPDAEAGDANAAARNRDQFKSAFNPAHTALVPAHVLPLRQPMHALLFNLRQQVRGMREGWRRG